MNCPYTGHPCSLVKKVHITDMKSGKVVEEFHCCHLCADKFVADGPQKPIDAQEAFDLLAAVIGATVQAITAAAETPPKPTRPPCPGCNSTLEEIAARNGRLGCAKCWTHFGKEMDSVLERVQRSLEHVGKIPTRWIPPSPEQEDREERIRHLTAKLQKAVEFENYEVANILKQKIEEIKGSSTTR